MVTLFSEEELSPISSGGLAVVAGIAGTTAGTLGK